MAGNSIHQDRIFLALQMPHLLSFLHYRQIDVSTIKTLVAHWRPDYEMMSKKGGHRAMDDIGESLKELRGYKNLLAG